MRTKGFVGIRGTAAKSPFLGDFDILFGEIGSVNAGSSVIRYGEKGLSPCIRPYRIW